MTSSSRSGIAPSIHSICSKTSTISLKKWCWFALLMILQTQPSLSAGAVAAWKISAAGSPRVQPHPLGLLSLMSLHPLEGQMHWRHPVILKMIHWLSHLPRKRMRKRMRMRSHQLGQAVCGDSSSILSPLPAIRALSPLRLSDEAPCGNEGCSMCSSTIHQRVSLLLGTCIFS